MVRQGAINAMGFYTSYLDSSNFDLVRFSSSESSLSYPGRLQFIRCCKGKASILADVPWTKPSDTWIELRQTLEDRCIAVRVDGAEQIRVPALPGAQGKVGLYAEDNPGSYFDNICVDFH
jgi:hypothetical protein